MGQMVIAGKGTSSMDFCMTDVITGLVCQLRKLDRITAAESVRPATTTTTLGVVQLIKYGAGRARPYTLQKDDPASVQQPRNEGVENRLSFPSAHTALAAAVSTAAFVRGLAAGSNPGASWNTNPCSTAPSRWPTMHRISV